MIEIYGFASHLMACHNCMKATKYCKDNELAYTFYSVISEIKPDGSFVRDTKVCEELMERMGTESKGIIVPKIFINNEYIGGVIDMKNHFKSLQK